MRTRFVIHKNLLGKVFRVVPRRFLRSNIIWNPEDICVLNDQREDSYFILPRSEYIPCSQNGTTKDTHADFTSVVDSRT